MQKKSTAMPDLMNCKFSFGSCSRQNMYLSACVISFSVFLLLLLCVFIVVVAVVVVCGELIRIPETF